MRRELGRWTRWARGRASRWRREASWLSLAPFVWLVRPRADWHVWLQAARAAAAPPALHLHPQLRLTAILGRAAERPAPPLRTILAPGPRPCVRPVEHVSEIIRVAAIPGVSRPLPNGVPVLTLRPLPARYDRRGTVAAPITRPASAPGAAVVGGPAVIVRLLRRLRRDEAELLRTLPAVLRVRGETPSPPSIGDQVAGRRATSSFDADPFTPPAAAAAGPPAVSVEHLTDQVMKQIDRRVTAWRERMGKV